LKLLYFGVFERPYDTETYIANTLELLGHRVFRQNTVKTEKEQLVELLKMEWDAVIFSKGWFPFGEQEARQLVMQTENLTIGWFWDLCWGTPREKKMLGCHHLFFCDLVLTSDGGHNGRWKDVGITHKILRQGIYEPEAVLGKKRKEFDYDVVFVGTDVHEQAFGWRYRTELLKWLRRTYGDRFKQFGGKDQEEIRNLTLNDLYASAKVVVGDSVYSPDYWSNRVYETMGRGGFLIFPYVDGMEKEFTPFKHFIPYNYGDYEKLGQKIDYYLKHKAERDEIRLAGFKHCKKNHTYTIRCRQLIEIIKDWYEN
jgi:hypothetical protein